LLFVRQNKKTIARFTGDGFMNAGIKKKFLSQQPPRASAHAWTTTTGATARRAEIGAI